MNMKNNINLIIKQMKENPGSVNGEYINQINSIKAEALLKFNQAYEAFTSQRQGQRNRVQEKIEAMTKELEDKIAAANEKAEKMGLAISIGDDERAAELEKEIDELNREAFTLERKIKTVGDVNISGDKDLFEAIQEKYEALNKATREAADLLMEVQKAAEEQEEKYRRIKEQTAFAINTVRSGSSYDDRMINAYESVYGKIDVSGHLAGSDKEAKRRFISGSIQGIENTPAGQILIKARG